MVYGTGFKGAKALGHGEGYKYPHSYPGGVVEQRYLPEGLPTGDPYYQPTDHGYEARIQKRLEEWARTKRGEPEEPPQSQEPSD